jgi:hypothetical protein
LLSITSRLDTCEKDLVGTFSGGEELIFFANGIEATWALSLKDSVD